MRPRKRQSLRAPLGPSVWWRDPKRGSYAADDPNHVATQFAWTASIRPLGNGLTPLETGDLWPCRQSSATARVASTCCAGTQSTRIPTARRQTRGTSSAAHRSFGLGGILTARLRCLASDSAVGRHSRLSTTRREPRRYLGLR